MKKTLLFCFVIIIAFASCKKDDSTPTYTKDQLIGTWKQVNPAPDAEDDPYIVFTDTKIGFGESPIITLNYTFENQVIKYTFLVEIKMKVEELTSTKLVVTESVTGYPGSEKITYTKQ